MSVVAPRGFRAAGTAAAIKTSGGLDLAVVAADSVTGAAAVFTVNLAAAAPVRLSRRHLAGLARPCAVVINSGCANAATGAGGDAAAVATAVRVGAGLGCDPEQVIVGSTGPIGTHLPLGSLLVGVDEAIMRLDSSEESGLAAATAIMTTDTVPKQVAASVDGVVVAGMAKGAGMVRPDMATMIVMLTTDAVIGDDDLDAALRAAVDESFHALNIDGCTSTNDMVVALASGASGVELPWTQFTATLTDVCRQLSLALARDAEGAGRVVMLNIIGAHTDEEARRAGRGIADSALVRASFYGGDPNWGRIVGALGMSGVDVDVSEVSVAYAGVQVAARGEGVVFEPKALHDELSEGDFSVTIAVGDGPGSATVITTDLTPSYVEFNGESS